VAHLAGLLVVFGVAAGGALAAGQEKPYPIFTSEHFVSAMKTVGQAFAAVNASLGRSEFDDSKAYLVISRDRLATTITFWRDRKKDDAVRMLRDAVTKMDDLDVALSAEQIDPAAVAARVKQVGAACAACHAMYREQDPVTKAYRLKTGTVD
jgi:mono/diheme cytochrome c family protein